MNVKITTQFTKIRFVSRTVDLWKDRRMRSFIGITAHYIDSTLFQFKDLVLACKPIFGSHTGQKILTEYNLKFKIGRVNSDNGANVVKAYKLNMIQMQRELNERKTWTILVMFDSGDALEMKIFQKFTQVMTT